MAQLFPSLWKALLWEWISCSSCLVQILNLCCLPPGCAYFGFKTSREFCCRLGNFQVPSLELLWILFHILDPTHSTFRLPRLFQSHHHLPVFPGWLQSAICTLSIYPASPVNPQYRIWSITVDRTTSRKPPVAHHRGNKESTKCV